jgi:hypothetical protein
MLRRVLTPWRDQTFRYRRRAVAVRVAYRLGSRRFTDARPDAYVRVAPSAITLYQQMRDVHHPSIVPYVDIASFKVGNLGAVVDGDWDLVRVPVAEVPIFQLLYHRFVEHREWIDSPVFREFVERVGQGERVWRSRSVEQVHARAARLDMLFESLKNEGFREDASLIDAITVNIARDGVLLFCNTGAHHRLFMAHLVGIPDVPAQVLLRHTEWQSLRDRARRQGVEAVGALQDHPDLADLRSPGGRVATPRVRAGGTPDGF